MECDHLHIVESRVLAMEGVNASSFCSLVYAVSVAIMDWIAGRLPSI